MPKRSRTTYQRNAARVKALTSRGASTREIAEELGCSTSTAARCKRNAQEDLDVSRQTDERA